MTAESIHGFRHGRKLCHICTRHSGALDELPATSSYGQCPRIECGVAHLQDRWRGEVTVGRDLLVLRFAVQIEDESAELLRPWPILLKAYLEPRCFAGKRNFDQLDRGLRPVRNSSPDTAYHMLAADRRNTCPAIVERGATIDERHSTVPVHCANISAVLFQISPRSH